LSLSVPVGSDKKTIACNRLSATQLVYKYDKLSSMPKKETRQLNHFIKSAPSGVVLTKAWLEQQGISPKLTWWYVRAGLLERLGTKAYKKAGDNIGWVGAVEALQNQMYLPLHVGGNTALRLLNRPHKNIQQIMLFAELETRIPSWLSETEWDADFEIYKTFLFKNHDKKLGIIDLEIKGINIQLSCPERAAMEILYLSPKYQTLFDVMFVMEKLENFRPAMAQSLLESCNSIKVKRFFLYFAERFWQTLVPQLDFEKINLGHGKRVIGRGGRYRYHPKYLLSLPEKIDE
jgi:hypothetical protein